MIAYVAAAASRKLHSIQLNLKYEGECLLK